MLSSLPGGLAGVKALVKDFHLAGVRVLLPYNPPDLFGPRLWYATGFLQDKPLAVQNAPSSTIA